MKVIVVGGSGFIGSKISYELLQQGNSIVSVDIVPPKISGVAFVKATYEKEIPEHTLLHNPDVVINLAGVSIIGPWNKEHKQAIYTSRIQTTKNLVTSFKKNTMRPSVFIQVSATGWYGDRKEEVLSEGSSSIQNTYLASVALHWEREGAKAKKYGIRTIIVRQGNVLGFGGIISILKPLYEKGLGGSIGKGNNWFPWIHIDDLVRVYVSVIKHTNFSGVVNAVAPEVVRYKEFSLSVARSLHTFHFLTIPKFLFQILYRGFVYEITSSQKVVSLRLWELGTIIQYRNLNKALESLNSK